MFKNKSNEADLEKLNHNYTATLMICWLCLAVISLMLLTKGLSLLILIPAFLLYVVARINRAIATQLVEKETRVQFKGDKK